MLRAGLIGLPSTGKTTIFQLLTRATETAAGGRGGRQEANVAISPVPDERLDRLTELFNPKRRVPATVTFADIASRGAAATLLDVAPFREAHALLHVVRTFTAAHVPHARESIDAARDAQAMEDELILADLAVAERRLERIERDQKKGIGGNLDAEHRVLGACRKALEEGTPLRALSLTPEETKLLRGFQFLSAKPLLLVINLDESEIARSAEAVELTGLTSFTSHAATRAVPVCAKIELEIADLDPDDARAFLEDLGLAETGLDRVIRAAYQLLGYISFFTVGEDECRAWSIPAGTPAQAAAGEIHSDIERGFIRAEVVAYNQLIVRGTLAACRDHGEMRLEGKEYDVADGDVVNFRFAT
jgi:GTP-binding protein YchF